MRSISQRLVLKHSSDTKAPALSGNKITKKKSQLCQPGPLGGDQVLVVLVLLDEVVPVHDVPDLVEPFAAVQHLLHVSLAHLSKTLLAEKHLKRPCDFFLQPGIKALVFQAVQLVTIAWHVLKAK